MTGSDTRGLYDPVTGVYWASDASPMPTPVRHARELDREQRLEGVCTFARYMSPWLTLVDEGKYQRSVDRIDASTSRCSQAPTVL